MNKPIEFWVALGVGALIVLERHKDKPVISRMMITAISAGIGYALAPEAAEMTGRSEVLAVMILSAFGYMIIDITTSLIADREFLKDIIKARLGGKS